MNGGHYTTRQLHDAYRFGTPKGTLNSSVAYSSAVLSETAASVLDMCWMYLDRCGAGDVRNARVIAACQQNEKRRGVPCTLLVEPAMCIQGGLKRSTCARTKRDNDVLFAVVREICPRPAFVRWGDVGRLQARVGQGKVRQD